MKKYLVIVLAGFFSIYMFGCGKKQAAMEESQEPMSMETLSTVNTNVQTAPETKAAETKVEATKLETLPPTGPYKPTAIEIQTALKNAGLYTGAIDGKIGPMTKKAIAEFQKTNGLSGDGKVGPKTWALLSKHLNPVTTTKPVRKKR